MNSGHYTAEKWHLEEYIAVLNSSISRMHYQFPALMVET